MKTLKAKLLTGISATLITASLGASLISCSKQDKKKAAAQAPEGWHLVWNDEFNGKSIDLTKWDFQLGTGSQYGLEGWGNNELQYYRKENASVKDGNLVLVCFKKEKKKREDRKMRKQVLSTQKTALYPYQETTEEFCLSSPSGPLLCRF